MSVVYNKDVMTCVKCLVPRKALYVLRKSELSGSIYICLLCAKEAESELQFASDMAKSGNDSNNIDVQL